MNRQIASSVQYAQRGDRQPASAPSGAEGVGGSSQRVGFDVWVRRGCGLIVTAVAAYSSYEHQCDFALQGGADALGAALWPLSVDGLLLLATVGLLKPGLNVHRRTQWAVWLAFLLGIAVSLVANIAAAPTLGWREILVAGWPPVALLLSVELLAHRSGPRELAEVEPRAATPGLGGGQAGLGEAMSAGTARPAESQLTAEQVMWSHFQGERSRGRMPTGAELDRVAGTNNYGRAVLARWRRNGQLESVEQLARSN